MNVAGGGDEIKYQDKEIVMEHPDGKDDIECGTSEARRPNVLANPATPSRDEVNEHNITHLPYRSWCPHCVRGHGVNMGHYTRPKDMDTDNGLPTIHADYGFLSGESEEDSEKKGATPIWCSKMGNQGAS